MNKNIKVFCLVHVWSVLLILMSATGYYKYNMVNKTGEDIALLKQNQLMVNFLFLK